MISNLRFCRHLLASTMLATAIITTSCNGGNNSIAHKKSNTNSLKDPRVEQTAADYIHGKTLFENHCGTCHVPMDSHKSDQVLFVNLFSPGAPSESFFKTYVSDSKKLKRSGDGYAIALDKAYQSDYEHYFRDSLSISDLDEMIVYIKVCRHKK